MGICAIPITALTFYNFLIAVMENMLFVRQHFNLRHIKVLSRLVSRETQLANIPNLLNLILGMLTDIVYQCSPVHFVVSNIHFSLLS
jgi:hypothetical protein